MGSAGPHTCATAGRRGGPCRARLWRPSDWSFALDTLERVPRAAEDSTPVSVWTEIRARERVMGTTTDARLAQRLRYVAPATDAAGSAASVTPIEAYRDRDL
jgi:hypothetical protein